MNMLLKQFPPALHKKLKIRAAEEEKTLYALVLEILGKACETKIGGRRDKQWDDHTQYIA